jgi:hypothetical protein
MGGAAARSIRPHVCVPGPSAARRGWRESFHLILAARRFPRMSVRQSLFLPRKRESRLDRVGGGSLEPVRITTNRHQRGLTFKLRGFEETGEAVAAMTTAIPEAPYTERTKLLLLTAQRLLLWGKMTHLNSVHGNFPDSNLVEQPDVSLWKYPGREWVFTYSSVICWASMRRSRDDRRYRIRAPVAWPPAKGGIASASLRGPGVGSEYICRKFRWRHGRRGFTASAGGRFLMRGRPGVPRPS